ncbi:hypothetical protein I4U23_026267 [Adineta vaga]|nr:hypothetical protein I4U23_026267 [Adineta vaga]
MNTPLLLIITIGSLCSIQSQPLLFDIQDTFTVACHHFPLISINNDSNLQCSRIRINENVPSKDFDSYNLTQLILFIIINYSSVDISPVNILMNINTTWNSSSSINNISIALLVTNSSFMINNLTTQIYSSKQIPIFQWKRSNPNFYNLTDLLSLDVNEYKIDTSICKWNFDRWNRLFNNQSLNQSPYAYIFKTTNTNLTFLLTDSTSISNLSPYLTILYCIPYKFGRTELILIITFGVLFILFLVALSALHYLQGVDNFSLYFLRKMTGKSSLYSTNSRTSVSSIECID